MKRKGLGITCLAAAAALVCLTGIYAVAGKGAKAPAAETEESGEAANIVVAEEAEENRSESEESEKENAQKEIAEAPSEAALASTGDLAAALQSEGMAQAARLIETARGLCEMCIRDRCMTGLRYTRKRLYRKTHRSGTVRKFLTAPLLVGQRL